MSALAMLTRGRQEPSAPAWLAELLAFQARAVDMIAGRHDLDRDQVQDAFQQALIEMWRMHHRGQAIHNPPALLLAVMHRRAIDLARGQASQAKLDARAFQHEGQGPDVAEVVAEHERSRHRREALRQHLSPTELQAALLCHGTGLPRAEAAAQLGLDERQLDRLLDRRVAPRPRLIGMQLDARGGRCQSIRPQVRAYARRELQQGSPDWQVAREHLTGGVARERFAGGCSACRHYVLALRDLAAVTPPVPLTAAAAHAGWLSHVPLLGRLLSGRGDRVRAGLWSTARRADQLSGTEHAREALAGGGAAAAGVKLAATAAVITAVGVAAHVVPDIAQHSHHAHHPPHAHARRVPGAQPARTGASSPPILKATSSVTHGSVRSAVTRRGGGSHGSSSRASTSTAPPPPATGSSHSPVAAPQVAPSGSGAATHSSSTPGAPQTAGGASSGATANKAVTLGSTPGPQVGP